MPPKPNFAVHLDHVRDGRAPDDYKRPERFFDRTFLTSSLRELGGGVIRRLSGIKVETSAIYNLTTQFGGGKTHALTLLYHLAKSGPAASNWKGVQSLLDQAGVKAVPDNNLLPDRSMTLSPFISQLRRNASRSALIVSACVVGMPCGNPL
jgi:hypothetical protein